MAEQANDIAEKESSLLENKKQQLESDEFYNNINKMLLDENFDKLELAITEPNIFRALGNERKELMHSRFLAYLLNPNENHGIGSIFIKKVLMDIFRDNNENTSVLDIDKVNYSTIEIRREWKNIDILIISDNYVIVIENKIDSQDHSGQLSRYKNIIESDPILKMKEKHYVYLTIFGSDPSEQNVSEYYMNYSYYEIAHNLNFILTIHSNQLQTKTKIYLKDYVNIINQELLMVSKINQEAAHFYKQHKDVLDFIYDNKPDLCSKFHEYLVKAINERNESLLDNDENEYIIATCNKGITRFYPKKLKTIVDKNYGDWWKGKESFAFELIYYKKNDIDNKIVLKATIAPHIPEHENYRQALYEDIKDIDILYVKKKPEIKQKWICIYPKNYKNTETNKLYEITKPNPNKLLDEDDVTIKKKLKEYFKSIEPFIDKITDCIISNLNSEIDN